MHRKCVFAASLFELPYFNGVIGAAGGEMLVVRREGHAQNPGTMTRQRANRISVLSEE